MTAAADVANALDSRQVAVTLIGAIEDRARGVVDAQELAEVARLARHRLAQLAGTQWSAS
jgi:hypothetical protein